MAPHGSLSEGAHWHGHACVHPQDGDGESATRLVVGNLTRNVSEEHLKEIFGTFGILVSVELAMDKAVNLPRGFAHVEFERREDAQKAIDYMHEGQIDGNVVRWAAGSKGAPCGQAGRPHPLCCARSPVQAAPQNTGHVGCDGGCTAAATAAQAAHVLHHTLQGQLHHPATQALAAPAIKAAAPTAAALAPTGAQFQPAAARGGRQGGPTAVTHAAPAVAITAPTRAAALAPTPPLTIPQAQVPHQEVWCSELADWARWGQHMKPCFRSCAGS